MNTQPYNPIRTRDIAMEMATIQMECGESLTRGDFRRHGFTDEQITRHGTDAGILFARMSSKAAA